MLKTKSHFVDFALKYLEPLYAHFQADDTLIKWDDFAVVYNQHIVGIEGFARSLWGLAPLFCCDATFQLPAVQKFWTKIVRGLKNATGNSNVQWEKPADYNQIYVELNAVAVFLLFNSDRVKQAFSADELDALCAYLQIINHHKFSLNN